MIAAAGILSGIGRALFHPHGNGMQGMLKSEISAGTIPAADQSALSSAISDINGALRAGGTAATGTASTTATTVDSSDPAAMKTRIDGLIDGEVTDGKLTGDQAGELKTLFAKAADKMAAHGHHHGILSELASLVSGGDSASTDASATSGTATTGTAATDTSLKSAADNALAALSDFITQLRGAVSSNTVYGASGASTSTSGVSSLLLNASA